ncbi:hypothetical protein D3C87_1085500 [compost metagenome]
MDQKKPVYWLWTMDLGDVMSETDDRAEIVKWHQFILSIERRDMIEGIKIVDIDQDFDPQVGIINTLNIEYKVKDNTFHICVSVMNEIQLLNALLKFDDDQLSQEIVQSYFFNR